MNKSFASLLLLLVSAACVCQEPQKLVVDRFDGLTRFNSAFSNYETNYFVLKKDSTGLLIRSKLYRDGNGGYYLLAQEKGKPDQKIYANQTIKITYDDRATEKHVEAIATDTCWLFKVLTGKISLYSYFPEPDYLTNEVLAAFQDGDNPIQPMDPEKLKLVMHGNTKALEALNKNDYLKAVKKYN